MAIIEKTIKNPETTGQNTGGNLGAVKFVLLSFLAILHRYADYIEVANSLAWKNLNFHQIWLRQSTAS
jgi:hypothetical protein